MVERSLRGVGVAASVDGVCLREEIERLRWQLHRAVRRPEDVRDKRVLALSRRLDQLVLQFVRASGNPRPGEQLPSLAYQDPAAFK